MRCPRCEQDNPSHATFPGFRAFYEYAEIAARALGVTLHSIEIRQLGEVDPGLAQITKERANGLTVWPTNAILIHLTRIVNFAEQHRLPTIFPTRRVLNDGGLMAYGANIDEQYRRVGAYVDKILKGANPADLPIEQPTKFSPVINLKTAKALGLTIPPSLLGRADELIQ